MRRLQADLLQLEEKMSEDSRRRKEELAEEQKQRQAQARPRMLGQGRLPKQGAASAGQTASPACLAGAPDTPYSLCGGRMLRWRRWTPGWPRRRATARRRATC